jgi:hypothetical protein
MTEEFKRKKIWQCKFGRLDDFAQYRNRTNVYGHVAMVHRHVWRTVCSVCATGARVAHPVPCNS